MTYRLEKERNRLASTANTLNAISPLQTLSRGYSITATEDGRALTDASTVVKDQLIRTRLNKGQLTSRVVDIEKD